MVEISVEERGVEIVEWVVEMVKERVTECIMCTVVYKVDLIIDHEVEVNRAGVKRAIY